MLHDILTDGLKLVICGTAPGLRSASVSQYYAKNGNKFWRTLAVTQMTPYEFSPAEAPLLLKYGIGLTDLVKDGAGSDRAQDFSGLDVALKMKINKFTPALLCFNGKKAAEEALGLARVGYGLLPGLIGTTRMFVAPSTSGTASKYWDESLWHSLAAQI